MPPQDCPNAPVRSIRTSSFRYWLTPQPRLLGALSLLFLPSVLKTSRFLQLSTLCLSGTFLCSCSLLAAGFFLFTHDLLAEQRQLREATDWWRDWNLEICNVTFATSPQMSRPPGLRLLSWLTLTLPELYANTFQLLHFIPQLQL